MPLLLLLWVMMEEQFTESIGVPVDLEMISVGLGRDVAIMMDTHLLGLQDNPECPEQIKSLPLWALRSNLVVVAITQMFELGDIAELWRGMDD